MHRAGVVGEGRDRTGGRTRCSAGWRPSPRSCKTRPVDELDLLEWKRRVFALYAGVRAAADPETAWREWREAKDDLFRSHPQSPLPAEARSAFSGLPYFDYDP